MDLSTTESVLLALLVVDAIALTVLVLLQQGKGADAGASFGSGSSNTMFGSLGAASFLTKATAWLAIGFFLIAFGLAYVAKERAAAAGSIGIPTIDSAPAPAPAGDVPAVDDGAGEMTGEEALDAVQRALEEVQQQGDVPQLGPSESTGDVPALQDTPDGQP